MSSIKNYRSRAVPAGRVLGQHSEAPGFGLQHHLLKTSYSWHPCVLSPEDGEPGGAEVQAATQWVKGQLEYSRP